MVLMRRYKDCVNAAPVSVAALAADPAATVAASASEATPAPVVDEYTFARLSLTTDISLILQREIRELFALRETSIECDDSFTLTYVDQAEQSLLRRMSDWQTAHPFWTMRRPTYQQLKDEETRKYKRREEERQRQAERSRSILAQDSAWPDLPKGPAPKPAAAAAQSKRSATASPQVGPSPAASSPALDAAAATAQPSPLMRAASASSAAGPSASPPLTSSASATAPAASASPAPAVSGTRSSFFNEDEHGIEDRYHREKAERAKQAAAAAAAAAATASSAGEAVESADDSSSSSAVGVVPPKPGRPGQSQSQSQSSAAPDLYHFYQSADGQQLYLHGLTFRSLLLQYGGNVSSLPARISGRIAHLDSYVVDRDVRAKHRFLSHLPLTASFGLALVDLMAPQLSRATIATMAPEFAADRKARQAAARRQKDLNKRTIQSSKALREAEGGAAAAGGGGGSFLPEWQQDAAAFPGLAANPLGFASGAPVDPSSAGGSSASASGAPLSGGSPQTRVANWNVVAEKGMASSELWAPLQSAPSPVMQSVSHWGSAAAPMAKPAGGSHPPSLSLGSAGWGRKPAAASSSSSSSHHDDADAESFPLPTVNRHGQTTLLSTAGRRSYK